MAASDDDEIGHYDHPIKQGNDCPLTVEIGTPNGFDGTGSEWVFTASYRDTSIIKKASLGEISVEVQTDPETSLPVTVIVVPFPPAFTRTLPVGRLVRYELERQVLAGEQKTYLEGTLVVRKGINVD